MEEKRKEGEALPESPGDLSPAATTDTAAAPAADAGSGLDELLKFADQAAAEAPVPSPALPGEPEKVQKTAKILPPELKEALGNIVYQFRVAMANLSLYPSGSRQALKATSAVYGPLSGVLGKNQTLTLSDADGALLANGAPLNLVGPARHAADFFLATMRRTGIKSLTLKVGLSLEELCKFLEGSNQKRWERDRSQSLQQLLHEEGITHVLVNERVFVSVSERDLVIEGGTEILARSGKGLDAIMNVIQEVMEMTEVEDQGMRDEVRMEIAKKLVQSDPNLLPRLLEGNPIEVPQLNLQEKPPQDQPAEEPIEELIPRDMLREVVSETARVYRSLLGQVDPMSEAGKQVEALKKILSRLLTLVEGKVDALHIYKDLLESGSVDLVPSWWGKETELARAERPEERAEGILGRDSVHLLDDEVRKELPRLVADLDLAERQDLTEKLMGRYAENLQALTATVRKKTTEGMKEILASARRTSNPGIVDKLDPTFLDAGEKETDEKVYEDLSGILQDRAGDLIRKGNYERTGEILALFRRHRSSREKLFEKRPMLADRALDDLARSEIMNLLLADLKSGDVVRQERARELVVKMEDLGIGPLIEEVKNTEDLRVRQVLVSVARNVGEGALVRLVAELEAERDSGAITRLMEVIRGIGMDELVLELLKKLLSHHERKIRLEAVKTLFYQGTQEAAALIATRIVDEDQQVRLSAIKSIGALKFTEAKERLHDLLSARGIFAKEEDPEVLESACTALGRIADDTSIPVLLDVLAASGGLSLRKQKPKNVRIAAARALSDFADRKEVRDALLSALKDKDPYLRKTAAEVIGR